MCSQSEESKLKVFCTKTECKLLDKLSKKMNISLVIQNYLGGCCPEKLYQLFKNPAVLLLQQFSKKERKKIK